ncbi:MAG TPA: xanthine dehydrogenase family protein molybdopterin-binding subunit [Xanthobacteraceae bacterium]|nr:xanthine dehydrogenase family protein molybdopterin-binding subunit [Xanthobacteraceae bacterium]
MDSKTVVAPTHHARVEDDALVRGAGHFIADRPEPKQAIAYFVRSPHAFARIRAIDVEEARRAAGVLAVLTSSDMEAAGVGNVGRHPPLSGRGGRKLIIPHRPALARGRVMHVGEPVVMIIAETLAAAQDAAELVQISYEELAPVVDLLAAQRPDAPQLWPEAPENLALDWPGLAADPDANSREVDRIIASASHVARVKVANQRLIVATMEPRGATASYDAATGLTTLRTCSQSAGALRENVLGIMGWEKSRLRVVTEDVGGAFGLKTGAYPEYLACMVGARMIGRPVHWMSSRSEAFLSDNQARDTFTEAELALDAKGRFLALRIRHLANMGAYIGSVGANIQTQNFTRCFPGMYDIRHLDVSVRCVFTNTTPTSPYRGAGRPEANYALERVVEEAARLTGIDRVKLRRRNLIKPSAMPYRTAIGTTFDSGEFEAVLDKALALADVDGFKQRRREAGKGGKYRGLGISCMLEHAGGAPLEGATVAFTGEAGKESLVLGLNVQSTGQGHASVFPRLAAEKLGISVEKIRHRHGDSAQEIPGFASVASRSAMTAGSAILTTLDTMLAKGKTIAATVLEAAEDDIAYGAGEFRVVGTDRHISLFDLATRAAAMQAKGEIPESLDTKGKAETPTTYPNGCHIAEVEVDPETGAVAVVSYTAVDDCGNILDHKIVEGQLHGAMAQGLGQALLETAVYDAEAGQLITGSFMDYAMPRAADMPAIRDALHPVPATTNPLGVKGTGEAATTAAIAAIMNAIADAVPGGAADRLAMPATPQKVWSACQDVG